MHVNNQTDYLCVEMDDEPAGDVYDLCTTDDDCAFDLICREFITEDRMTTELRCGWLYQNTTELG